MPQSKTQKAHHDCYKLPQILPQRLLAWYDVHARALPWRENSAPYHVWLSEIMLQQTGAEVVKDYYKRFLEAMPTIEALASADEQTILKLWEGLGYYSRARNLLKAAQIIGRDNGGQFPDTVEKLMRLPGVGSYTAGAIASICFNQPVPAVDGNVVRVVSRLGGIRDEVTETVRNHMASSLKEIYPAHRCGDFTQSLMELGATVCLPNGTPKCQLCPASDLCTAYRDGTAMSLPVKQRKKAKKLQELTVFLLSCGDNIAIRRRANDGLLAGLWELPHVSGQLSDNDAVALAAEWHTKPDALLKSTARSHIFTHIKWNMRCYYIACKAQPPNFTWVSRQLLDDVYALPTAFKKFVDDSESAP